MHRSETSLARRLRRVGERHRTEHEVAHLCGDLAGWSDSHIQEMAAAGRRYGVRLRDSAPRTPRPLRWLRERFSVWVGRRPEPALALLADLRGIHLHAAAVALDWVTLAQGAQAARDTDLLTLVSRCHSDAVRQMRWATTMVKALAPQALMS